MFTYEIEFLGVKVKNSKVLMRELTDEEKAEAEAKGGKGKAAPAKGKNVKEDEPTPEELEKMEKARLEKEEREKRLAEEWEQLDEEEKFFRTNEDIYKEPCIKMQNLVQIQQVDMLKEKLEALGEPSAENEAERGRL